MKYLLNKNLKAIACGESIEAGEGEIVFDPEAIDDFVSLHSKNFQLVVVRQKQTAMTPWTM